MRHRTGPGHNNAIPASSAAGSLRIVGHQHQDDADLLGRHLFEEGGGGSSGKLKETRGTFDEVYLMRPHMRNLLTHAAASFEKEEKIGNSSRTSSRPAGSKEVGTTSCSHSTTNTQPDARKELPRTSDDSPFCVASDLMGRRCPSSTFASSRTTIMKKRPASASAARGMQGTSSRLSGRSVAKGTVATWARKATEVADVTRLRTIHELRRAQRCAEEAALTHSDDSLPTDPVERLLFLQQRASSSLANNNAGSSVGGDRAGVSAAADPGSLVALLSAGGGRQSNSGIGRTSFTPLLAAGNENEADDGDGGGRDVGCPRELFGRWYTDAVDAEGLFKYPLVWVQAMTLQIENQTKSGLSASTSAAEYPHKTFNALGSVALLLRTLGVVVPRTAHETVTSLLRNVLTAVLDTPPTQAELADMMSAKFSSREGQGASGGDALHLITRLSRGKTFAEHADAAQSNCRRQMHLAAASASDANGRHMKVEELLVAEMGQARLAFLRVVFKSWHGFCSSTKRRTEVGQRVMTRLVDAAGIAQKRFVFEALRRHSFHEKMRRAELDREGHTRSWSKKESMLLLKASTLQAELVSVVADHNVAVDALNAHHEETMQKFKDNTAALRSRAEKSIADFEVMSKELQDTKYEMARWRGVAQLRGKGRPPPPAPRGRRVLPPIPHSPAREHQ